MTFGATNVGNNPLATLQLSQLDGQIGFQLDGFATTDRSGTSVRLLGDVNGDGFGDASDRGTQLWCRRCRSRLSRTRLGLRIRERHAVRAHPIRRRKCRRQCRRNGSGVLGGAGDINGDGIADFIIGVPDHSATDGAAYVIFGSSSFAIDNDAGFDARQRRIRASRLE